MMPLFFGLSEFYCIQSIYFNRLVTVGCKTLYNEFILSHCNTCFRLSLVIHVFTARRFKIVSDVFPLQSAKSCGDPGHVLNGRRIGSSFVFLGSVEYTCNPGYDLRGLSRRYCQADQEWSGSLPTCHRECFTLLPTIWQLICIHTIKL